MDGIRLHIGGRERRQGWTVLDVNPGPHVDCVCDCRDMSFLPEASCAEVYASHVLEHFGYDGELQHVLRGIHRILKPGGLLRVSVPDLDILCRLFTHPQANFADRYAVMQMMFGGRRDAYDIHYAGLSYEILGSFLLGAGFQDLARVQEFGIFRDFSGYRYAGALISLNIEAYKRAGDLG